MTNGLNRRLSNIIARVQSHPSFRTDYDHGNALAEMPKHFLAEIDRQHIPLATAIEWFLVRV